MVWTRVLLEDLLPESQSATQDLWSGLSERKKEVFKIVALGNTSAEIAEQLNLSAKTVETYRARHGKTGRAQPRYAGEVHAAKWDYQQMKDKQILHTKTAQSKRRLCCSVWRLDTNDGMRDSKGANPQFTQSPAKV